MKVYNRRHFCSAAISVLGVPLDLPGNQDVFAKSSWNGVENSWTMILRKDWTATATAEIKSAGPKGNFVGTFSFHDPDFAEVEDLENFFAMPDSFGPRMGITHHSTFTIELLNPATNRFKAVKVWLPSSEKLEKLKSFAYLWHGIWMGVPGAPRFPLSENAGTVNSY